MNISGNDTSVTPCPIAIKPESEFTSTATAIPCPTVRPPVQAANALLRAYTNVADEQGWAMLGQMSTYIHANHPDFDPRTYGCAKFIDLVQKTASFELVQRAYKNGQSYFCRPFNTDGSPAPNGTRTKNAASNGYQTALKNAVQAATATNGWAPIGIIGQKLKGQGHSVKESGQATLTDALKAAGIFEMSGSGAARYFRIKAE